MTGMRLTSVRRARSYWRRALDCFAALCAVALLATAPARGESLPADAPDTLKALIGEYESEAGRLTVYEDGGRLHADGAGLAKERLRAIAPGHFETDRRQALVFELDAGGHPDAVRIGGNRLSRRDIGLETVAKIRAGVNGDPQRLRKLALAASPPSEPAPKHPSDLVNLATVDPTIRFDIRYATSDNFVGFPLYDRAEAYLQRPATEALGRAHRSLTRQGYGLLIHDAYRPWYVTRLFWDATPEYAHVFVADPAQGSRHNRGCAVDLTLYELKSGRAVEMTGRYDEMSVRSYADYIGGTSRQRWLRQLLRSAMEAEGFSVYAEEWWHFDYKDWRDYGIGTLDFGAHEQPRDTTPQYHSRPTGPGDVRPDPRERARNLMTPYVWTMALAIASVVFYQMGQKLVPSNASPFVVFATAYGAAGLLCLAAIVLSPKPITSAEFRASIGWPTWLIALTIFGIELGFLLVYRSGWKMSIAYAVSSIIAIIVLAVVGTTLFGETLSLRRMAGIGMACASLWLLVSGGAKA